MKNKSLKRLREIIGSGGKPMTQKQFAAMVGVSLSLIKNVECGQQPLGKPLANKITLATGAQLLWWDFRHIRQGKVRRVPVPNGKIYWLPIGEDMVDDVIKSTKRLGRTYTREHFDYHRRFFQTDQSAAKLAIKEAAPALERLFMAASKPGVAGMKNRLPALRASFWEWIRKQSQAFKLGAS